MDGSGGRGRYPSEPRGLFFFFKLSLVWVLMYSSSSCPVICSVPFFFSSSRLRAYLKGSWEKLDLSFSFLLLRFLILSAHLRFVSLALIDSWSIAFLHAFRTRRRSFTSCRISLSHLPLCLGRIFLCISSPNLPIPSS